MSDNKKNIFDLIDNNNWRIEKTLGAGTIFVLSRGFSVIIGYPRSDKYRENGQVFKGLVERLGWRTI